MRHRILATPINSSLSLVAIRDRSRQVGELFGLDNLQRTRFVTAISELVRNAVQYAGGGTLMFFIGDASEMPNTQCVVAQIADKGPGIDERELALAGIGEPARAQKLGIPGSRRLVDAFFIDSVLGEGTTVTLEMYLPRGSARLGIKELNALVDKLTRRKAQTPIEELEQQSREMLLTLEELRRNKVELENADLRKNEFLAMLAHELRNPLASISLSLEVAKRGGDPAPLFDVIGRQTAQLSRMVNDLLDVSRLTQGKVDLQTEIVLLQTVLEGAIEMTAGEVSRRGHQVDMVLPPHPIAVRVDVARMKQVFSNVLHNAARYTPRADVITVAATLDEHHVTVAISDRGVGIDPELLPRVFDLFAQGNSGLARQDSGLGIGLTVVQRLVVDHGGDVYVTSPGKGQGSTFHIRLPFVLDVPPPHAAPVRTPAMVRTQNVMIVDDNRDSASALAAILDLEGYACREACDGAGALTLIEGFAARLCVIDIGLPDMTGFDVARALRARTGDRPLTLVALSGYSNEDFRAEAARAGFDHYFAKPVPLDELLTLLATLD